MGDEADSITVAYSDSGRIKAAKVEDEVPIVGYLIAPELLPPRRVDLDFRAGSIQALTQGEATSFEIPVGRDPTVTASTATVSQVAELDPAFLKGTNILPVSVGELDGTKAGRGCAVYDLIAYGSLLRRLSSEGVRGPIIVRTDGELPSWISGDVRLTLDVGGRDISGPTLSNIREMEKSFAEIRHETYRGSANRADSGPLRDLKRRIRHSARV